MIAVNPPVVKSYAPATQPIAFVSVVVQRDELIGRTVILLRCLNADKKPITVDRTAIPAITPEQASAFIAAAGQAGDTQDQNDSRRALPIVSATLGLTGSVV